MRQLLERISSNVKLRRNIKLGMFCAIVITGVAVGLELLNSNQTGVLLLSLLFLAAGGIESILSLTSGMSLNLRQSKTFYSGSPGYWKSLAGSCMLTAIGIGGVLSMWVVDWP